MDLIRKLLLEGLLNEISSEQAWVQQYSNIEKFPLLNGDKSLFDEIDDLYIKKGNQHNRTYFMWLYRLINKGLLKREDFYKVKNYLRLYDKFTNKIPVEFRDINKFSSVQDLYDVIKDFEQGEDTISTSKTSEIKKIKKDEVSRVYEDSDWLVLVPKTERASCLIGKGTQWCTAADKSDNMFDYYNNSGSLYVLINKDDDSKYQLHFESNQLMDVNDRAISAGYFFAHVSSSNGLYEFLKGESDKFYEFIIETSLADVIDGSWYEVFDEALSILSEGDSSLLESTLSSLRGAKDSRARYLGYIYEDNPYRIIDYDVKEMLEDGDMDEDDLNSIIKHLVRIDYDLSDVGYGFYDNIIKLMDEYKLEFGGSYDLDGGKRLRIDSLDLGNTDRPIRVTLDGQRGNIGIEALKNLVYNRSLFERLIKR